LREIVLDVGVVTAAFPVHVCRVSAVTQVPVDQLLDVPRKQHSAVLCPQALLHQPRPRTVVVVVVAHQVDRAGIAADELAAAHRLR
jgi:hypothetical protein